MRYVVAVEHDRPDRWLIHAEGGRCLVFSTMPAARLKAREVKRAHHGKAVQIIPLSDTRAAAVQGRRSSTQTISRRPSHQSALELR